MNKHARSTLLNVLIIIGTLGIVLYLGSRDGGLGKAWNEIRSADWRWVLAAFGCWILFVDVEGLCMRVYFSFHKLRLKWFPSILVGLIGLFYSGVTPAATGGQPMQVVALKKYGVPAGVSSSCMVAKFFVYQLATLVMAVGLWILNLATVRSYVDPTTVGLIILGFFVNGLSVAAVLLVAINKNVVRGIINLFIWLGKKLRLVRHEEKVREKAERAIHDFDTSVDMIKHHPDQLLRLFLLACVQLILLMGITYCVYRSLGLKELSFWQVTALQFLLYVGASYTPLPGASGAQETGFVLVFKDVFMDKVFGAQLMWRFFTYYITLIIGVGAVIINSAGSIRRASETAETAREEMEADLRQAQAEQTEEEQP